MTIKGRRSDRGPFVYPPPKVVNILDDGGRSYSFGRNLERLLGRLPFLTEGRGALGTIWAKPPGRQVRLGRADPTSIAAHEADSSWLPRPNTAGHALFS